MFIRDAIMPKPSGFSENAMPFAQPLPSAHGVLAADGRLLIPAALRDAAGIKRGDKVFMRIENGQIVVESFRATITRIQDMLAYLKVPGQSIVDELIADRRAESLRESEE